MPSGNTSFLFSSITELRIIPDIKKVIFNDPATIILWSDGTKTVVKCQEGDTFPKYDSEVLDELQHRR